MIVEHTFITTVPAETVIQRAREYLVLNKFKVTEVQENKISAVRGRVRSTHPKLERLPQIFEMSFDRGRVNIGMIATLYHNKKKPVHAVWLTACMTDMERLLTCVDSAAPEAYNEFSSIERTHKSGWSFAGLFCIIILSILALLAITIICSIIFREIRN